MKNSIWKMLVYCMPVVVSLTLYSCKKNDQQLGITSPSSNATAASNTISANITIPVTLNLYPGSGKGFFYLANDKKLFMPVTRIGTTDVKLQVVFDTGSEGLVLYASRFLPDSLMTQNGFNFNGKDSLVYNGITITRVQLKREYGIPGKQRTLYGNVAYACVRLGDSTGAVTTGRMPVFLAYQMTNDQTGDEMPFEANHDGIGGVRSGSVASNTAFVTNVAGLKTPFSYLSYAAGIDAGFILSPVNGFNWDALVKATGNPGQAVLTIGINSQAANGYLVQHQALLAKGYSTFVQGTLTYNGTTVDNAVASFDTGTPNNCVLSDPSASQPFTLADGAKVNFTSPEGISYGYTVQNSFFTNTVEASKSNTLFSLNFFMDHYFLLNYSQHTIGIKQR